MSTITGRRLRPDGLVIEARRPGVTAWTALTGGRADFDAGDPIAVGSVSVSWSTPSPLNPHPDPTDTVFSLLADHPDAAALDLIQHGTEVRVRSNFRDADNNALPAPVTVAAGWVNAWTRRRLPAGRWLYTVSLVDALARLAAWPVAFNPPRPRETAPQRYAAINAALPAPLIAGGVVSTSTREVLEKDVDNRPAIDVLADTVAPDEYAHPTATNTVAVASIAGRRLDYANDVGGNYLYIDNEPAGSVLGLVHLSGRQVRDAGVGMTPAARLGSWECSVGRLMFGNYNRVEYRRTLDASATGRHTVTTDAVLTTSEYTDFMAWLDAVVTATLTDSAGVALNDTELILTGLDLAPLLAVGLARFYTVVYLSDLADPVIDPLQFVTAATLTLTPRRVTLHGVKLAPGALFGLRRVRFSDVPINARLRPNLSKSTRLSRIRDFAAFNPVPMP